MNRICVTFCLLGSLAILHGQSGLVLAPSEPLSEPQFPKRSPVQTEQKVTDPGVRPGMLILKPSGDPIYIVEEVESEADQWRTYRRPKVDRLSKTADGVAIQGYDVLSYLEKRAEKGSKSFSAEHLGVTWWFTSAEHRNVFVSNPAQFVPEYGGFCAYSIGKGFPATADPEAYSLQSGKLYLFFNRTTQKVWEQDQQTMTRKGDTNWPKLHR
ncbi:MAG: hypothetical protein H7039_08065 [Bryobacteraceae bacterium]|nr:hypothetical protein [Bryobacteraceae bacterium]